MMSPIEELFQLVTSKGMSLISKKAGHDRWMMILTWPGKASIGGARMISTCEMEVCTVVADTPAACAFETLDRAKKRIAELEKKVAAAQVAEE